jgi:oligopeptide/dipeptide ABC transporter ATP-binding protein
MYIGKMMEIASSDELYEWPLHPYTKALLSSIPVPDPDNPNKGTRIIPKGDVQSPINPKPGCRFASRCTYAKDKCFSITPEIEEIAKDHFTSCHFVKEINPEFFAKK